MKATFKSTAAAVALFAAIGTTSSFAQLVTYNAGDIVIGFQDRSGAVNQNFMFNVGYGAGYNNGTMPLSATTPIANIGDHLEALYGANWYSNGNISWGAIGMRTTISSVGPIPPSVDGDAPGVVYASRAATGIGESTPYTAITRSSAAAQSVQISGLLYGSSRVSGTFAQQDAIANSDNRGVIVEVGVNTPNSWSAHVYDEQGFSFGRSVFAGGIEGTFGTDNALAYLDIYRMTPDNIESTWVVTFAIDSMGNIYAMNAIPEPSTYAAAIGVIALGFVFVRRMRSKKAAV